MSADISVSSRLGEGSVFTFLMPVEIILTPDEPMTKTSKQAVSIPEKLFSGSVLLAEDHTENRRLIARLLTKLGLTVLTAVDGLDAIALALKHHPDIILLDIQMPKMDGIQAYKMLRQQGYYQPIIALTANTMSHDVERYLTLGFNGHLSKPLNRQNLIATITKYFPNHTSAINNAAEKALNNVDMSDLVMQFKASLSDEKEQLSLHVNNQDMHSMALQTHRLIGASQLFGFYKLADVAAQLETCIKANDRHNVDTLIQNLLDEITTLTS
jgi:CheY-like chemotaxis protein